MNVSRATPGNVRSVARTLGLSVKGPRKSKYDQKQDKKISKLNKFLKSELRQRLISSTATALATTGTAQLMNGMAAGDIVNTREGTKINMLRCNYRVEFQVVNANVPTGNAGVSARVMLIYDNRPNGAIYSADDLLNSGGTAGNNYLANRNWNFKDRFKILYDKNVRLGLVATSRAGVATTQYDYRPLVLKIRRKINKRTFYNSGVVGDITDIVRGSLYLTVYSDINANWFTSRIIGEVEFMP